VAGSSGPVPLNRDTGPEGPATRNQSHSAVLPDVFSFKTVRAK
jgi:hypothetical protein